MKITEEYIAQSRREGWFLISSILTAVVLVVNSILIWKESVAFFAENSTATATEIPGQWLLTVNPNASYFGHIVGYYVVYLAVAAVIGVMIKKTFNSNKPDIGWLVSGVLGSLALVSLLVIVAMGLSASIDGKVAGSAVVASEQLASEAGFSEYSHSQQERTLTIDGDGNGYSFDVATVEGNTFYTLKQ